jgi:hypothetical protein
MFVPMQIYRLIEGLFERPIERIESPTWSRRYEIGHANKESAELFLSSHYSIALMTLRRGGRLPAEMKATRRLP